MIYVFDLSENKVAEIWSLGDKDLKPIRMALFMADNMRYATATSISDRLVLYDNEFNRLGIFIIREMKNSSKQGNIDYLFLASNVLLEQVSW